MAPWGARLLRPLLLLWAAAASPRPAADYPAVLVFAAVPASLEAHHVPQPSKGFAVRVGMPFELEVAFARPLPNGTVVRLGVHADAAGVAPLPVLSHSGASYVFGMEVPLEAPAGVYDNLYLYVGNATDWGLPYHVPDPVTVVSYNSHPAHLAILHVHVVREFQFHRYGTSDYRIPLGVAVRRGDSFKLRILLNQELPERDLCVTVQCTDHPAVRLRTKVKGRQGHRYFVVVTTPVDAPIGRYADLLVSVQVEAKSSTSRRAADFPYPWPLYIVFNAYHPEELVYLKDTDVRREYLENEHGLVFNGPIDHYETIPWYYGQYSQQSLEVALHLLAKCTEDYSDVIPVVRCLSARILAHDGNDDGIVVPRWPPVFLDGVEPDEWSSTEGILNQWVATNYTPVKYGQCWIIAAITCTLLRALGIPTRQVVAFGAIQDDSGELDPNGIPHHVVLNYYLSNGRLVTQVGHVWRFHSFVDIWLRRLDLPWRYSGWQAVDATVRAGRGLGPASVRAIKEMRYDVLYNVTIFVGTLHSAVRDVLVHCCDALPQSPRISMTDVEKCCIPKATIQVKDHHVPLMVTTAIGEFRLYNITDEYVDPTLPAEVPGLTLLPEPDHPPRTTLTTTLRSCVTATNGRRELAATVLVAEALLQPEEVDVSIIAQVGYPDGRLYTELRRKSTSVLLHPRARCIAEVDFRFKLPTLPKHLCDARFLEVRALAVGRASGGAAMAKARHRLC